MEKSNYLISKGRLLKPFIAAYFLFASVEIIAEFYKDVFYISISKPFLMPLLMVIYWCSSRNVNFIFILSLLSVWIANIFFISSSLNHIIIGTLFFLSYRILIIYMVFKIVKFPGYVPMLIGSLPFLIIYLFFANLTHNELGNYFYLFVIQGIFMIFFGGYCLGNFILKSNTSNTYLLISTMLFTITQFILAIKVFYLNINFFQPFAMLLFVIGQYLLYRFLIIEEKKKKRYMIINKLKNTERI